MPAALPRPVVVRLLGPRPALLAAVAAAAAVLTTTVPAAPAHATAAVVAGSSVVADAEAPTAEQLAAQRAEAARLAQEAAHQQAALAAARAEVTRLAAEAGAAMERYQQALRDQDAAEAEHRLQVERLQVARDVLAGTRTDLGRWASQAYRDGGAMADYEGLMTLLEAESTDDLGQRLAMLRVVGRVRGSAVETARGAELVRADAERRAQAAKAEAAAAADRADRARRESDELLTRQRDQVAALDALRARTEADAQAAKVRGDQMATARAVAEQRRLASRAAAGGHRRGNQVTGPVGACTGGDVSAYGNGRIPLEALCPVAVAPAHRLRADAAYALDALAGAYAAEFGTDLCITDSYRSAAAQVRTYAAKPGLAAVPGTSNHGWGTAVDLCGGIERFGTAQHDWMRDHASLYGWFHPSWAQQGGSRPEPWHWEFGG